MTNAVSRICELTGAEFPLFAFSHCRDVVAAVTRAGGFGVLGANSFTPERLEEELCWIDAHVGGRPYGVDVLIPQNIVTAQEKGLTNEMLRERVPAQYHEFTREILSQHGVRAYEPTPRTGLPTGPELADALMDVAFRHPIRLIANALGVAPQSMIERARHCGVPVAALVGAREHALHQARAGVDIIVAQGAEAGGHCGEVSTLVLTAEVIATLGKHQFDIPVLAAGGIMTGRQMAGMVALGAAGAWTGSVWLATPESESSPVFREKMIEATSRDTVRSRSRTGKPSRQLRSAWTDAWEQKDSLDPLPMPLQSQISEPALRKATAEAEAGNAAARELVTYWVGQGVGLIESVQSAASVVQQFKEDYASAVACLVDATEAMGEPQPAEPGSVQTAAPRGGHGKMTDTVQRRRE